MSTPPAPCTVLLLVNLLVHSTDVSDAYRKSCLKKTIMIPYYKTTNRDDSSEATSFSNIKLSLGKGQDEV